MVSTLFSRGKSLLNSSCVRSNSSSPAGNRSNCWQPREKCGAELKLSLCFVFRVRFWNFLTICTIDSIAKRGRARNVVVVGCRGSRAGYAVPSAERFSASYCIIKMPKREKKGGGLTPDLFPTEHFLWTRLHPSHWPCRIPPNAVPRAMWLRTVYYRNRTILHGQQWEGWSFTRFFFPFPSPCPDWWWRMVSRLRMIAVAPKRDSNNMEENRVNDQNMNAAARSS